MTSRGDYSREHNINSDVLLGILCDSVLPSSDTSSSKFKVVSSVVHLWR